LSQRSGPGTDDAFKVEFTVDAQGLLPGHIENGFDLELLNGLLLADTGESHRLSDEQSEGSHQNDYFTVSLTAALSSPATATPDLLVEPT
jgi:hypothetical protein